jgi:hypothetical protein
LVLAGRDGDKATGEARDLNARYRGDRCCGAKADASHGESLQRLFQGADLVVAASSTSAHAETVAEACLSAGLDYMEVLQQEVGGGGGWNRASPPPALLRHRCRVPSDRRPSWCGGRPRLDSVCAARVGSVIRLAGVVLLAGDDRAVETEFREYQALTSRPLAADGLVAVLSSEVMTFGHGFGRRYTMPMFSEPRLLRSDPLA